MRYLKIGFMFSICMVLLNMLNAQSKYPQLDKSAAALQSKLVEWRRYLHQHPELSNREYKTAAFVAAYLKQLGIEVQTGVGKTGVVAILKGVNQAR